MADPWSSGALDVCPPQSRSCPGRSNEGAIAAVHESLVCTFQTFRGGLTMSVDRGRPEVTGGGGGQNDEMDPLRTLDQRSYTNAMTKPVASAPTSSLKLRRLEMPDIASYRELRLEGLKAHPEAFASSWDYEADKPVSWWAERLEKNVVIGGWVDTPPLLGVAGLRKPGAAHLRP